MSKLREPMALYGITLVVTVVLTLLQSSVGWLRGYLLFFVAATFLYLPIEFLHRRGEDPADLGIHRRAPRRALRLALLVALLTFPPYLVGFHVWQIRWLQHRPVASPRFDKWPAELAEAPRVRRLLPGEVRLYTEDERITLRWRLPLGQRFAAELTSEGPVHLERRIAAVARQLPEGLHIDGRSDGRVVVRAPGPNLRVDLRAGGDRLPAARLRLGSALQPAPESPLEVKRSYLWLIVSLLTQIIAVALPEEVFYRGYLQTRLDKVFDDDRLILGVAVSPRSLLLTSALFALGHFLTIPNPARLGVFFPSLLFGWMRRAGGGVMAAVLYHAGCNLLVEIASVFYA